MTGEGEAATETVEEMTVNEMRVRVSGGSRRYVIATVDTVEHWMVDHHPVLIQPDDVVGFRNDADASHFIGQGRATDLGRWDSLDDLRAAFQAQQREQQTPKAAKKGKSK